MFRANLLIIGLLMVLPRICATFEKVPLLQSSVGVTMYQETNRAYNISVITNDMRKHIEVIGIGSCTSGSTTEKGQMTLTYNLATNQHQIKTSHQQLAGTHNQQLLENTLLLFLNWKINKAHNKKTAFEETLNKILALQNNK